MSAYISGTCSIQDQADLLAALAEMGYEEVEVHETPAHLIGYKGDTRKQTAHVVIRRRHVGIGSNDVGFERQGDGTYTAHVSQFDQGQLRHKHGCQDFVTEVKARAAVCAAERAAKKRGFRVTRKVEGRKVHLLMEKLR